MDVSNLRFSVTALLAATVGFLLFMGAYQTLVYEPESGEGGIPYAATLLSTKFDCTTHGKWTRCDSEAWVSFVHEGRETKARIAPYKGDRNATRVDILYKAHERRAVLVDVMPSTQDIFAAITIAIGGLAFLLLAYRASVIDEEKDPVLRFLRRLNKPLPPQA